MMIIITLILVWLAIWLLRRYVKYILLRVPYIRIDKFYLIDCLKGSLFFVWYKILDLLFMSFILSLLYNFTGTAKCHYLFKTRKV